MRNTILGGLTVLSLFTTAQNTYGPEAEFAYDLTYDFLIPSTDLQGLNQQWFSNGHTFSFMGEIPFGKASGIGYGLGFSVHNLHNNLAYVQYNPVATGNGSPYTLPQDSAFNINEQDLTFLEIPLEIRGRGKSGPTGGYFRYSFGVRAGYRIISSAYHRDGDYAIRQYRLFTNSPFRLQVFGRLGYRYLAIYGGYDILPTLQNEHSGTSVPTKMHMVSVGMSLLL